MSTGDGFLPDIPRRSSMPDKRATRAQQRADLDVFEHGLKSWATSMKDQIDSMALGEAIRTSTEEEMDTYDELMLIAGDSEVKKTLVMRKLSIMSNTNNARLRRHFR
jgi:polyphosphate kinase